MKAFDADYLRFIHVTTARYAPVISGATRVLYCAAGEFDDFDGTHTVTMPRAGAVLRLLQLLPRAFDHQDNTGSRGWAIGRTVELTDLACECKPNIIRAAGRPEL
jgi:hypothetical protein